MNKNQFTYEIKKNLDQCISIYQENGGELLSRIEMIKILTSDYIQKGKKSLGLLPLISNYSNCSSDALNKIK